MKMKSYAKSCRRIKFNWIKFLKAAIKKAPTDREYSKARKLAGDWPTCACGVQCEILPRCFSEPTDKKLNNWGMMFSRAINKRHFEKALQIMDLIERRAAKLVKIELAKIKARKSNLGE